MSSYSSSEQVVNVNGYANVTADSYLPVWSNAVSLCNSIFFLIVYSMYLIGLVIFLFRMNRKVKIVMNHKILISLTLLFVSIQCINLVCRIVLDSITMRGRIIAESGQLVEWGLFVSIQVMAGITTFAMYINLISLFEILFFIQSML